MRKFIVVVLSLASLHSFSSDKAPEPCSIFFQKMDGEHIRKGLQLSLETRGYTISRSEEKSLYIIAERCRENSEGMTCRTQLQDKQDRIVTESSPYTIPWNPFGAILNSIAGKKSEALTSMKNCKDLNE